jgi:hypothetical protein
MPRGKAIVENGADPRKNKMEAVRQALNGLGFGAVPKEIQQFVQDHFGQEMSLNMISSYKSSCREKAGIRGRRRKRGRPKKDETLSSTAAQPNFHDFVPWKDLRTIKDIASRIGKKGLRELVELLD